MHTNNKREIIMINSIKWTVLTFCLLFSVACVSSPPRGSVTEYVKTEGGGFAIENGKVWYGITYKLLKNIGDNPSIKVAFENHKSGGAPLILNKKISSKKRKLVVSSPHLPCAAPGRNYNVTLKLYSNNKLITTHKDKVQFSMPKQMLKQVGVKLCT
jgi:hypothetical protein